MRFIKNMPFLCKQFKFRLILNLFYIKLQSSRNFINRLILFSDIDSPEIVFYFKKIRFSTCVHNF